MPSWVTTWARRGTAVEIGADRTILRTSRLAVTIQHSPFRLSIADSAGTVLDEDDKEQGIAFSNARTRVWKRLTDDDQIFGLGEKTGHLNKRGRQLGGYNVTMWNSDTFAYEGDTDPIYASVPFYIVLRKGRAHGIFLDNTFRTNFDIGHTSPGLLAFGAEGGDLNYYVIDGPDAEGRDQAVHRSDRSVAASLRAGRWAISNPATVIILTRRSASSPTTSGSGRFPRTSSGSTSTTRTAMRRSPGTRRRFRIRDA